jgi:acetyl coenzyme A synthetase (ADP forming)-like protein
MYQVQSLDAIFKPRSIAIIGATTRPGSIGREIISNLFGYDFNGMIFPVNPKYEYIHSTKCYPTVLSIPDPVDLAVIVVPKEHVLMAAEDCGRKGVKGMVIITAGFKEVGGEGVEREQRLVEIAKKYGMRIIGPNCMGVIAATPDVRMNATFSPSIPKQGNLAFMTQSGALGVAIILAAQKLNLGFSYFASVGNKADVSAVDLMEYWEDDQHTGVIGLYLESFDFPRRFTELSKRISKTKPIVTVKSGTSAAGARAATSHTGSLAGLEVAADALLRQCGVIRVSSIEYLINVVTAFARSPLPRGDRVAIVTNAGGPGIMAADSVESNGLKIAELSDETSNRLKELLPAEASVRNPVDMIASAGAEEYAACLDVVLADPNADLTIAIFVPPLMIEPLGVVQQITEVSDRYDKPVLAVIMAEETYFDQIPEKIGDTVPYYRFPEAAAETAAAMVRYSKWRTEPAGNVRKFDVDLEEVIGVLEKKHKDGGGYLESDDVCRILKAYGFPVCRQRTVPLDGDLAATAGKVGYPLVLKVAGKDIVHKTDIGGVEVGINNKKELIEARKRIESSVGAAGVVGQVEGYVVQEMAQQGKEIILGVTQDPKFGPLLMFGMGGKYVEILRDVAFRVLPVTDVDAQEMVHEIKSYPLLEGVRGDVRVDIDFITEAIQRLAQLVTDTELIAELDMNPVIVRPNRDECRVVDARIRVRTKSLQQ